ncbi:MAG: hypothetical protein CVU43_04670 [Chloroflexi bacterium HGW-Chloroflexi-5]|jgi:hypothetical protein|nr:MAG: hypothetical protein CVU43_04670 [Chloroflexi bacterium HGW-Chloroflexi-5]
MAETKTVQKGWRFTPEIAAKLEKISKNELRSEQNMVEVLIHERFIQLYGPLATIIFQDGQSFVNRGSGVSITNS